MVDGAVRDLEGLSEPPAPLYFRDGKAEREQTNGSCQHLKNRVDVLIIVEHTDGETNVITESSDGEGGVWPGEQNLRLTGADLAAHSFGVLAEERHDG